MQPVLGHHANMQKPTEHPAPKDEKLILSITRQPIACSAGGRGSGYGIERSGQ